MIGVEHARAAFNACRRTQRRLGDTRQIVKVGGCGGKVFWSPAEPSWLKQLGLVGVCTMCGTQWFTSELLKVETGYLAMAA